MPLNSYFGEFNFHHMPFALLPYHHVTASPLASIMATTAATSHHQSWPRPPPPWCIQMHQVGFFFPFFSFYFTNPGQCLYIDCAYSHHDLHLLIPPPSSSLHQNSHQHHQKGGSNSRNGGSHGRSSRGSRHIASRALLGVFYLTSFFLCYYFFF